MPARPSPFDPLVPSIMAAGAFAAAAMAVGADLVPSVGRWLVVHLVTLGVLTNLVLAFSGHFTRTLTRRPGEAGVLQLVVANVGVLGVLVGLTRGPRPLLIAGGTGLVAAVLWSWWRLRRNRRLALGARFTWVVRLYERAHGAFVHGGVLGLLLGIGVVPGAWYVPVRVAHIHVMVLGWVGITLLATLVFFGPSLARTRIVEGAEARAVPALRRGATGLSIGVLLLVASGVGGAAGSVLRVAGAAGLGVLAGAATVVGRDVALAVWRAPRASARRVAVGTVAVALPVLAWADVLVLAVGRWAWLDGVGFAFAVVVLAPIVVTTVAHVLGLRRRRSASAATAPV